jgi:hypothetical protein
MNNFIEKLEYTSDVNNILSELDNVLKQTNWFNNQIGFRHRPDSDNIWNDGTGSLYDHTKKKFIGTESHYNTWSINENNYIRTSVTNLSESLNFKIGRVRIMKLLPHHGLSVHRDNEVRYHLVLKTNPKSYICYNHSYINKSELDPVAQCYHLPLNNYWYKVNTKITHWVYNGGETERIHLVVCET